MTITSGTLLAERYRLTSRAESDLAHVQAWQAQDQILDRTVRVAIVDGPRAQATLEEARRASLVNDPRLVRILDVGSWADVKYVVTEALIGEDLSIITSVKPLSPLNARAVIGEVASALEVAHSRGVNHLALRPHVIRVHEGRIQVTGLGIDGTLYPRGRSAPLVDARADVEGLLSLLFYAMTGSWPSHSLDSIEFGEGVQMPPLAVSGEGSVRDPRELNPTFPGDLAELCLSTLASRSDGPHAPAQLVTALRPWGTISVTPPRVFSAVYPDESDTSATTPPRLIAPTPDPGCPTRSPDHTDLQLEQVSTSSEDPMSKNTPGTGPTHHTPAVEPAAAADLAVPATPPIPATSVVRQSVHASISGAGSAAARPPGTPPPAIPTSEPGRVARKSVLSPASAPTSPSATPVPSRGHLPVRTPGVTPEYAPVSAPPRSATSTPPVPAGPAHAPIKFEELISTPKEYRRFRFNPTALTLLLALVAVLFGLYLAFQNLASGWTGPFSSNTGERPLPPSATSSQDKVPDAKPTTIDVVAPIIASGQQLDPQGDNNEHPEAVDLAFDQDPSTFWYSRTYKSASFAGMGKSGIGFAVTLEEVSAVSTVYLSTNNTGGKVEIRATDPSTPTKGEVLASSALSAEMDLTLSKTVNTQHIVLWFTELPQVPNGSNRIELLEISLT